MKTFQANGFDSVQPDGWQDRSTLTLVGPVAGDGFASNIVVTQQPVDSTTSVTQFAQSQLATLATEVQSLDIADEREVSLNGRKLYQRLHSFTVGQQRVAQVQTYVFAIVDDQRTAYVITGTTSPEAFDAAMPAFKAFIEGFKTQHNDA